MLQQRLSEESRILMAICNERLPADLLALKIHVEALTVVMGSSYVGPDEIVKLRQRLDVIIREIQNLAETKISENSKDKMAPFRQQAAAIAGVKRNVLEKLEKTETELVELLVKLEDKRDELKFLTQELVPKGQELKRYVARLKSKSDTYKRSRAELAGLRAECGLISRTLVILNSRLVKTKSVDTMSIKYETHLPDNYTEANAISANSQLSRNLSSFRVKLSLLLRGINLLLLSAELLKKNYILLIKLSFFVPDLQSLRQLYNDIQERCENARASHNSLESSAQLAVTELSSQVKTLSALIEKVF